MKYPFLIFTVCILLSSCETPSQKGERLAHQYCGSCHAFPDPSLLDKKTWEEHVLPEMAFRMGMPAVNRFNMRGVDAALASGVVPSHPMVTDEEWEAIKNYFITKSPNSLPEVSIPVDPTLEQFDVSVKTFIQPLITLLKVDSSKNEIWIGTRSSRLYELDYNFSLKDSFQLSSPPSSVHTEKDKDPILSVMGIMDPNDAWEGQLIELRTDNHTINSIIDSLQRPVCIEKADLNNDKLDDYVICAFGNYTGALLAYENLGNGNYKKHILYGLPGARKIIIRDVNEDGLKDVLVLMTQGDEQISLLTNGNNFNFRITTLLRFPPVYGSSYFDVVDFNHDGNFDILYTNGDNADFSMILKPYHGVHIFINNRKNEFKESIFLPMHGASQAFATDFDQDGDVDIAAISFFPDFKKNPAQGFIYFENKGKDFLAHSTPLATLGRWLVMDAADIDHDGDTDILLGAMDFDMQVTIDMLLAWQKNKTSVLLLKNNAVNRTPLQK